MIGIIFIGIITVVCLICTIYCIVTNKYFIASAFGLLFLVYSYLTFDITTDYLQKSSPKFVYRANFYKVFEYTCDDKPMVKVLENDNDLFFVPESLLIVRCTDEIERK